MKNDLRFLSAALLFLVGVPATACAADAFKAKSLELYPTWSAVSIELAYTGDDNRNAKVGFVWRRQEENTWRNGVDLTFDRERRLLWASIWPLKQGERIEVKVKISDKDAASKTLTATTVVRDLRLEAERGKTFYLSPNGDDCNPGSKAKPFRTLAHAADVVRPGDTVLAMSGVYREGDLLRGLKGTKDKPIVFAAAEGAKPVIDSSMSIRKKSERWTNLGGGVFVTQVEFDGGYVAQDGRRMFPYAALADLKADKLKVQRAWFYDKKSKRLYVRPGTEKSAEHHNYKLSKHNYAFWLSRSAYIVLRGLTIRNFGRAGVRLSEGARGCILYGNTISNAPGGIFMKSPTTRENAIWHNEIFEPGLSDFSWQAHYAVAYANQAVYCSKAGRGNSFCHNRIHGYFDLIAVESWRNPGRLEYNRDCDIMFNTLYNASDDAIEVDGGGVNMRVHGNRIRNCLTAISLAPIERGPVYVTRNHATYLGLMFKFNVNGCTSFGWTYCYHNSGYCLVHGPDGGTAISFPPRIPCSNKVLKNNILVCNEWSIRAGKTGYILDGNCYYPVPNKPPRRFQWNGKAYRTLKQFHQATGQEEHGIYADPKFVSAPDVGKYRGRGLSAKLSDYVLLEDAKVGDLHLGRGSPCIDRGVIIRGLNDDYAGKSPDIGAFERRTKVGTKR